MSPAGARRAPALACAIALLASACSSPILANPPLTFPSPAVTGPPASAPPDPITVEFPLDDGPHDRLTEWWYYTGHLRTADGRRFGFEAVVFRAERGTVPTTWAGHLALTDEQGGAFHYAQRSEIGSQVDHSPRDANGAPSGFDLRVGGLSPVLVAAGAPALADPWRLDGASDVGRIDADLNPAEAAAAGASFGLHLGLHALKAPALHDGDGFVDFGPAGSSYYYSRTRMAATGSLTLDGQRLTVDGIAWFDHQWGDFVSVGAGWDWFALNLDDGRDLTMSVVRGDDNAPALAYGTFVDASGRTTNLTSTDFAIRNGTSGTWQSPSTGRIYTLGWSIDVLAPVHLSLALRPVLDAQELDTRATTGVSYWEGAVDITGTEGQFPEPVSRVTGQSYVEMTRYGP